MILGIYEIENKLNGKVYGGSSTNVKRRWQQHRAMLQRGIHHCYHLQNAWNEYGEGVFKFTVVEEIEDADLRIAAEQRWLDTHHAKRDCYNIAITVEPSGPMSSETKQKMRERMMGNQYGEGNKNHLGCKHTEESKRKMGTANKGRKHTAEARREVKFSLTFRSGKVGSWKDAFTEKHKFLFKEQDKGGWLVKLGFADNSDW